MQTTDFILKDHQYEFQQDSWNTDGTSNMATKSQSEQGTGAWVFGRFNQCFISSAVMSFNQCLTRLRDKGVARNEGFSKSFIDELAYKAIILSKLNGGDATKDNSGRYVWNNHCDLLNELTKGSFKEKVPGEWVYHKHGGNPQNVIKILKSNYQPLVGINIRKYYGAGGGHVTTAVGWRETSDGKFAGLYFNDPAGNLVKKGSYRNAKPEDGIEAFYNKEQLKNTLMGGHIMYLREF